MSKAKEIIESLNKLKIDEASKEEIQLRDFLFDLIYDTGEFDTLRTFEEEGILTSNTGLVIGSRGKKFQIQITKY